MSSKNSRNAILTLIILAIGIKLLLFITGKYVDIAAAGDLGKSLISMSDLLFYGLLLLALLLVPFYLNSRSNEKKAVGLK